MKFDREKLIDGLNDDDDSIETVCDKLVEQQRWASVYEWVFKHDGRFYRTSYSVGATEYQDERPFEYDGPEIECEEVVPKEVTTIKYVKAK